MPTPWIAIPVVLAALVHGRVVDHYFIGDEFFHFFNLMNYGLAELLLTPHGGHLLLTSNSSYFLFHALFGYEAAFYYGIALLTHLVNVGLLFQVVRCFSGSLAAAVVGSTVWGVSPLAEGSVGWFGVYGHVLVGSCVIWMLFDVARLARGRIEASGWMLARWIALLLAAATSFGFGLSIALAFGPALFLLLAGTAARTRLALRVSSLLVVIPVLYLLVHWLHQLVSGRVISHGVLRSFGRTPFSLADLPVIPLAFLDYLSYGIASLPIGFLIACKSAAVAYGPLEGVPLPEVMRLCWAVALVCVLAVTALLWRSPAPRRSQALGLGLLVVACYGTIALWAGLSGRGTMAASAGMPPVWQAMTPRYHYVAPMLLAIIGCLPFGARGRRVAWHGWSVAPLCALGVGFALVSAGATRALRLPDLRERHQAVVAEIQRIVDGAPPDADVYIRNRPFRFWGYDLKERFPGWAAVFVISYPEDVVDGRRVYFVEPRPRLRERLVAGGQGRLSRVLVAPEAVPDEPVR